MSRRPACSCVLVLLGFAAAGAGGCASRDNARPDIEYERRAWDYDGAPGDLLISRHYEIYSTLRDDALVETLPAMLETAFEHYRSLVPSATEPQKRMPVYIFSARSQWSDFTRRFAGPRAAVFLQIRNGGYCERGVTVMQYVAHQTTFPILTHEGFHQYLYFYVNPNVPAWLNEGLATLCEGQRWESAWLKEFDPRYNPIRRNALADAIVARRLIPLSEILETHAGKIVRGTSKRVATYYGQVWGLMLFLEEGEGGRYAPGFRRLLAALGAGDLEAHARAEQIWSTSGATSFGEGVFRTFITEDLESFEREYQAYLTHLAIEGN